MTAITKLPALLKREVLEHKNLWKVPAILIGISALVKLSLMVGNLSFDFEVPKQLELDNTIDTALDSVIATSLNSMNYMIMMVMFIVAIFYALACLFNERQDESVLFWRSLPISDSLTVASKLIIALAVIPVVIVLSQAVVALIFFGADAFEYLGTYYSSSLALLVKVILWSMLPVIAWCVFCSSVASKNPFLMAFIAPIILILVDKLFLDGVISQTFIINRLTGISDYTTMPLIWGLVFSGVCIALTITKRSQRI
ncbi:MAG: hypothetical protein AAF431_13455 [Pseudomonadota bacterium]